MDNKSEKRRLQSVLSHAGVCSRRAASGIIESGRVKVDGSTVRDKGARVDPSVSEILLDDKPVFSAEKKHYYLFNKPLNVISTVSDTHDRRKITDFFSSVKARLYPVGRLDKDTTGLIIVTNDGELCHRLSHPSFEVEKEYMVTVSGSVPGARAKEMEGGVVIDGEKTYPCRIDITEKGDKYTVLTVKLHEGRKRQIRKMFAASGFRVRDLERIKYAGLTIDGLKSGEYRALSHAEVEKLFKLTGRR
ncbi:MAG: rRNA pseudouridine synthase [Candidatus Omnitrophica bacterium]|nr:rRNA pseudouridine synthase [Candidatus Omnitrophota bacterium]